MSNIIELNIDILKSSLTRKQFIPNQELKGSAILNATWLLNNETLVSGVLGVVKLPQELSYTVGVGQRLSKGEKVELIPWISTTQRSIAKTIWQSYREIQNFEDSPACRNLQEEYAKLEFQTAMHIFENNDVGPLLNDVITSFPDIDINRKRYASYLFKGFMKPTFYIDAK